MVGFSLIDHLWLSFQFCPMHLYLRDYVLTLCEARVTQTWLMRWYRLWLLWQLLIRDWLGAVAMCVRWAGKTQCAVNWLNCFLCTPSLLGKEACMFKPSEPWEIMHTPCRNTEGERRSKRMESSTLLFDTRFLQPAHHSSIMYDYEAIPQRLLGNGPICRARRQMWKQKSNRMGCRSENSIICLIHMSTSLTVCA